VPKLKKEKKREECMYGRMGGCMDEGRHGGRKGQMEERMY
jgi:hypothetical protein